MIRKSSKRHFLPQPVSLSASAHCVPGVSNVVPNNTGLGMCGPAGAGIAAREGVMPRIDVIEGTLAS
jgi:hypothetical protein